MMNNTKRIKKNILTRCIQYVCFFLSMATRKAIPEKMKKLIYQQFISACGFCRDDNINVLEIHHIQPYAEVKKHEEDNLFLVCRNCHAKIENNEISEADVFRKKINAIKGQLGPKKVIPANILNFQPGSVKDSNFISGQNINIKMNAKKPVKLLPPHGTIASDADRRNYIKHLIDKYHTYKKADQTIDKMDYRIIYASIKREFKAKWDMIRLENFDALSNYLQNRIDKTILGKNTKAQGNKNYSNYQEYILESKK